MDGWLPYFNYDEHHDFDDGDDDDGDDDFDDYDYGDDDSGDDDSGDDDDDDDDDVFLSCIMMAQDKRNHITMPCRSIISHYKNPQSCAWKIAGLLDHQRAPLKSKLGILWKSVPSHPIRHHNFPLFTLRHLPSLKLT